MTVIQTARIRLEPLAFRHAAPLHAIYSEPGVRRFLISRPGSRAEFDRLFAHALDYAQSHGMWAIVEPGDSTVIGRVGFFAFGAEGRPELAFLLSQRSWGRGLATEAASAAVRHALASHDWSEIMALVRPANRAAIRVLCKLGMQAEQNAPDRWRARSHLRRVPSRLSDLPDLDQQSGRSILICRS